MNETEAVAKLWTLIGTPWKEHGDTEEGMDCWGLIRYAFRLRGIALPFDIYDARRLFVEVRDVPRPFDVGYFAMAAFEKRHVGLFIGPDEMIHGADPVFGVTTVRRSALRGLELLRYRQ